MVEVVPLEDATPQARHVAVGTFDGVHLGHREVIDDADTVLTFEPHPLEVIQPAAAPKLLMSFEQKRDAIEALGVSELVVIPFDHGFAEIEPQRFIDEVIVERLGAERVSVGENFGFGSRVRGNASLLASQVEFSTRIVPLMEVAGETVSSTRIRALIAAGDIALANRQLGSPFERRGKVVTGDQRGRDLGFPTANLIPDDRFATPGHGVYAALANGHPAAVSIGVRPTFETGRGILVEAYLIDFDADLYGEELRVQYLQKLRGEHRFDSTEELVEQMDRDVEEAARVCASFQRP